MNTDTFHVVYTEFLITENKKNNHTNIQMSHIFIAPSPLCCVHCLMLLLHEQHEDY